MDSTCDSNRLRQGCRIQEGTCLCGTGCDTDYRYANKRECESALRGISFHHYKSFIIMNKIEKTTYVGHSQDPCSSRPCNRGSCLQILNAPTGYTCLCSGTNYYGERCEHREFISLINTQINCFYYIIYNFYF